MLIQMTLNKLFCILYFVFVNVMGYTHSRMPVWDRLLGEVNIIVSVSLEDNVIKL